MSLLCSNWFSDLSSQVLNVAHVIGFEDFLEVIKIQLLFFTKIWCLPRLVIGNYQTLLLIICMCVALFLFLIQIDIIRNKLHWLFKEMPLGNAGSKRYHELYSENVSLAST